MIYGRLPTRPIHGQLPTLGQCSMYEICCYQNIITVVGTCVSTHHALEFSGDKADTRRRPPIKTIGREEKALVDLSYHRHRCINNGNINGNMVKPYSGDGQSGQRRTSLGSDISRDRCSAISCDNIGEFLRRHHNNRPFTFPYQNIFPR